MYNLYDYAQKFQIPLIQILGDMELRGMRVDVGHLKNTTKKFEDRLNDLYNKINSGLPKKISPHNVYDLRWLLYEYHNFEPTMFTEKTNQPKTSTLALDKIREDFDENTWEHKLLSTIMEYIHVKKLFSSVLDPLLQEHIRDGVVHTNFNQTRVATGRLSSNAPNMQQIPKRTNEFITWDDIKSIRNCFIARDGMLLVAGDYSQLEMRIAGWYSGDPTLVNAARKGLDMHAINTIKYFKNKYADIDLDSVTKDTVTKNDRTTAKTLGFLFVYLGQPKKAAKVLQGHIKDENDKPLTGKELLKYAEGLFDTYNEEFAPLNEWRDETIKKARKREAVFNAFGRRRLLPKINDSDDFTASRYERMAVNTPIQSTAVDCCLYSMQRLYNNYKDKDAHMLLQIHDDVTDEVSRDILDEIIEQKVELMSKPVDPVDIPLVVDIEVGERWGDLEEYSL